MNIQKLQSLEKLGKVAKVLGTRVARWCPGFALVLFFSLFVCPSAHGLNMLRKYYMDGGGPGPGCQGTCCSNYDGDNYGNCSDNCPYVANNDQLDTDGDGKGNACDNCPTVSNSNQANADGDVRGDVCDCAATDATNWQNIAYDDPDRDGVRNSTTAVTVACFGVTPPADMTGNGVGLDNCLLTYNPTQVDSDQNGIGDLCQDSDGDGVLDIHDNCVNMRNLPQTNRDCDEYGDACDPNPDNRVIPVGGYGDGGGSGCFNVSVMVASDTPITDVHRAQVDLSLSSQLANGDIFAHAWHSSMTSCAAGQVDCYDLSRDGLKFTALYMGGGEVNQAIDIPAGDPEDPQGSQIELFHATICSETTPEINLCGEENLSGDLTNGTRLFAGFDNVGEYAGDLGNLVVYARLEDGTVIESCSPLDTVNNIDFTATPKVMVDARTPVNSGWGSVDVTFDNEVTCFDDFNFTLENEDGTTSGVGFASTNACSQVNAQTLRLTFNNTPFPAGQWTKLIHQPSSGVIRIGRLPCDIDQDGRVSLLKDWPAWVKARSEMASGTAHPAYQVDLDRDGTAETTHGADSDEAMLSKMLNGLVDGTLNASTIPESCVENAQLPTLPWQ